MINAQPKKTKPDRLREKKARKKVKKKVVKKKKLSLSKEKTRADMIMSIYIRFRDCLETTNTLEFGRCFTCNKTYEYIQLQNGHFIGRAKTNTRFSEDNCNIQCFNCNMTLGGNYIIYTTKIIDIHGRQFVEELKERGKTSKQFKAIDMIDVQNHFLAKIKELTGFVYKWGRVPNKNYYKWVQQEVS